LVNTGLALRFLSDYLFDSSYNLCREDLGSCGERYWTCSDNALACRAFELMQDYTHRQLILNRLQGINIPCSTSHDATINHFHDPVTISAPIDDPPLANNCYLIDTSKWTASQTPCPNSTVMSGVFHEDHKTGNPLSNYADVGVGEGYANVCFLEAISYKNVGQNDKAATLYQIGRNKWDGKGFNDSAYASKPIYDAYKLALCIIASQMVNGRPPDIFNELDAQVTDQQSDESGGINSQYTSTTKQQGSQNCETTAMTIIAYKLIGQAM